MTNILGQFWREVYGKESPQSYLVEAIENFYEDRLTQYNVYSEYAKSLLSAGTVSDEVRQSSYRVLYPDSILSEAPYLFDGTLDFDGSARFGDRRSGHYRIPVPEELVDPFLMADDPVSPSFVMQRGIDFELEDGYITTSVDLRSGVFRRVLETGLETPMVQVWFLNSKVSTGMLQRIYGDPLGISCQGSPELANTLWSMFRDGCSTRLMYKLLCQVTDTDYVDREGTVRQVYSENGRVCVATDDRLYTSPEAAGALVSEGDEISEGQFIFGNASVYYPSQEIPQEMFPMMQLGEGMVGTQITGGVGIVNEEADVPALRTVLLMEDADLDTIDSMVTGDKKYLADVSGSYEIYQYDKEPYTYLRQVRIYDAPDFRGIDSSVLSFLKRINSEALASGKFILKDLTDQASGKYNLFELYKEGLLGSNAVFFSVRVDLAPAGLDPALALSSLKMVMEAGTSLLTFFGSEAIVEYSAGRLSDALDVFHVVDAPEEYYEGATSEFQAG